MRFAWFEGPEVRIEGCFERFAWFEGPGGDYLGMLRAVCMVSGSRVSIRRCWPVLARVGPFPTDLGSRCGRGRGG